jgi:hypothetical protein
MAIAASDLHALCLAAAARGSTTSGGHGMAIALIDDSQANTSVAEALHDYTGTR